MPRFITRIVLCAVMLVTSGCEFRPHVSSAQVRRAGNNEEIEIKISSKDATSIKRRQLYFRIYITKCGGGGDKYFPVEPYIDGGRAADFEFSLDSRDVSINGALPAHILRNYEPACAALNGAGYFMGRLKSAEVPIRRAPRKN